MITRIDLLDPDRQIPPPAHKWGDWTLNPNTLELCHPTTRKSNLYRISLRRMNTSDQSLDWIVQIAKKAWAHEQCVANLISALDEILDFQSNYCSFGKAKQVDGTALAQRYADRVLAVKPHLKKDTPNDEPF